MQRPEEQAPAVIQAQAQPLGDAPMIVMPKKAFNLKYVIMRLSGAVLLVLAGLTLLGVVQSSPYTGMSLLVALLSVFIALLGAGLLQAEYMEKLTGRLVHDVFPDAYPKFGPESNGQLYGQNMINHPGAKHPHDNVTPFPVPRSVLHPAGMGADARVNAPVDIGMPQPQQG